jgi:hypothetical protein
VTDVDKILTDNSFRRTIYYFVRTGSLKDKQTAVLTVKIQVSVSALYYV